MDSNVLPPKAVLPKQATTGWGKVTWREPLSGIHPRVVNISNWDLCGISYNLQQGFERYTEWDYRTCTIDRSWVWEPQACDLRLGRHVYDDEWLADIVMCADILHLNQISSYLLPFLTNCDLRGKKIFIHHHAFALRNDYKKWEKLESAAGYGRLVSTPDLLRYASPGYKEKLHWLPSPINLDIIDRRYPRWRQDPDSPLNVLHGYTVGGNKGTDTIERMVGKLRSQGEHIELGLMTGLPQHQSRWYMSQCDVYFATMLYGPGMGAIEAMAMGIPTLVGCNAAELVIHKQAIGVRRTEDLPWIYVTSDERSPDYAGTRLRELANEPALREYWGAKGRRYIEEWHDLPVVTERLQQWYRDAASANGIIVGDIVREFE
jgi:hypothetical protein